MIKMINRYDVRINGSFKGQVVSEGAVSDRDRAAWEQEAVDLGCDPSDVSFDLVERTQGEIEKIDRNGSTHARLLCRCSRCGGDGIYKWGAVINGRSQYAGTCFRCDGSGQEWDDVIFRLPSYEHKLSDKRNAAAEKRAAELAEQQRIWEEAKRAREEAERAAKAKSQHVGSVGDRIDLDVTCDRMGSFEQRSFRGFGTDTVYVYTFRDQAGNAIVWKTQSYLGDFSSDKKAHLTATVKEHDEYRDERQTIVTRAKVLFPDEAE